MLADSTTENESNLPDDTAGAQPPAAVAVKSGLVFDEALRTRLHANDRATWKEVCALIRNCSKWACWKINAPHIVDDAEAELLSLFYGRLLDRMQPGLPMKPFLMEAARRVALSARRRIEDVRFESLDDLGISEDEHHDAPKAQDFTPELLSDLTAQKAKERIRAQVAPEFWDKRSRSSNRNQYRSGNEKIARQWRTERERRGWTQKQMASYIGVPLPTLISYEHACVILPSAALMDKLRALQADRLEDC